MNKSQLKCAIPVILLLPFVLIGIAVALAWVGLNLGWSLVDRLVGVLLEWVEQ